MNQLFQIQNMDTKQLITNTSWKNFWFCIDCVWPVICDIIPLITKPSNKVIVYVNVLTVQYLILFSSLYISLIWILYITLLPIDNPQKKYTAQKALKFEHIQHTIENNDETII